MSFKFNPFISNFDNVTATTIGAFDTTPNANGLSVSGTAVSLSVADGTHPGGVSTTAQTFGGNKTFTGTISASNLSGTNTGDITLGTFGSSANSSGASLSSQVLTLQPANGTNPGGVSTTTQSFGGDKTFNATITATGVSYLNGGVDTTAATTLAIGTLNATTINIGNAGSTINLVGTVITEQTTTLNITNPVFTLNVGGSAGSASNSGMQIQENALITGYIETSADRNSWIAKAPNTAGVATITPGAGGITLNQSSHNPVTLGTTNGLSLSTQQLSLQLATTSLNGALSSTDWNTFNNKQAAGNYITALTGDATAAGPGSAALTLATVNGNVGSFGSSTSIPSFTVNAKGLITAASGNVVIAPAGTLTGTTLNATVVSSSLTSVGTIATGVWNGTAITDTFLATISTAGKVSNSATTATSANTPSAIVARDGSGNFTAGTITASLTGTASGNVVATAGDIAHTSFTIADNQSSAADVTGFLFANATVRSFEALVSVVKSSTFEVFKLYGIQRAADWNLTVVGTGDTSGVAFTITNAGQVQYTSTSTGATGTAKFRALVTSV